MSNQKLLPLGVKKSLVTDLPALMAAEQLQAPWLTEEHLADIRLHLLLAQRLGAEGDWARALAALDILSELLEQQAPRPQALCGEIKTATGKAVAVVAQTSNKQVDRALIAIARAQGLI